MRSSLLNIFLTSIAGLFVTALAYSDDKKTNDLYSSLSMTPDRSRGVEVYEVCSVCHLVQGWGLADGSFPQLSGQHQSVLVKQLQDIREGHRDIPTMYPFSLDDRIISSAGYRESEIDPVQLVADVTAYISELPMSPNHGKGPWEPSSEEYEQGQELYKNNCKFCHGDNGEGNSVAGFPRIHGQHYAYMVRQFEWILDGKRRNTNPAMESQINNFSPNEIRLVLNYVSQLKVPKELLAPSANWNNPDYK